MLMTAPTAPVLSRLLIGGAIALRSALKKSRKGSALATSVAFISVAIHNQTTIVRSDRFTRTVSCQPFLVRVLFAKGL